VEVASKFCYIHSRLRFYDTHAALLSAMLFDISNAQPAKTSRRIARTCAHEIARKSASFARPVRQLMRQIVSYLSHEACRTPDFCTPEKNSAHRAKLISLPSNGLRTTIKKKHRAKLRGAISTLSAFGCGAFGCSA
jgi:hypothetical protein